MAHIILKKKDDYVDFLRVIATIGTIAIHTVFLADRA